MYQQQLTHPSKSSFHVNQPLAGFCQQNSHPDTPAISRQGITTRGKHSTCQQTQHQLASTPSTRLTQQTCQATTGNWQSKKHKPPTAETITSSPLQCQGNRAPEQETSGVPRHQNITASTCVKCQKRVAHSQFCTQPTLACIMLLVVPAPAHMCLSTS